MNCGTCQRWSLVGPMGQLGYGICNARNPPMRDAMTTSAQCVCRVGKFVPLRVEAKEAR